MSLIITQVAKVTDQRDTTTKALRQTLKTEHGISGRRLDNFTLTAMRALAMLRDDINTDVPVALISAAKYFSIELLQNMITQVELGQPLKPLDFVATVGNSANYYLAKEFNLRAANLFLGCSKNPLNKAFQVAELELLSNGLGQAIVLIWQENHAMRSCYACLVSGVSTNDIAEPSIATVDELNSASKLPYYWRA